jgi:hypothetical protein
LKPFALRRETGRSSSFVAGNIERIGCLAAREDISGSPKKLKLKVGDGWGGISETAGSGTAGALLLTIEADSELIAPTTELAGVGTSKAFFPISSGNWSRGRYDCGLDE